MDFKNKDVLVVGMAKSGMAAAKKLKALGARVTLSDNKTEDKLVDEISKVKDYCDEMLLGIIPQNIQDYDLVVLSPGVPTDLPFIVSGIEEGAEVIGELELAYRLSKGTFIGITGTNGKTTTTALTGEILEKGGVKTFVVGNIGLPVIDVCSETTDESYCVTEVSSFQLETIVEFEPQICAILNITPDHLNRHKTMDNYIAAKKSIYRNQQIDGIVILNYDNEITRELASSVKSRICYFSRKEILPQGVFIKEDKIVIKEGDVEISVCDIKDIFIKGSHNIENALAATAISYYAGIKIQDIKYTLMNFKGVEHRNEYVCEIDGVKFYNDSKGTNPDSSIKAVESLKAPIILIAGGMDKKSSFKEFVESFDGKVKQLVLLGETKEIIKAEAEAHGFKNIHMVNNMEEAVAKAWSLAKEDDTILLSPACASWDMYKSFEVRGAHFKQCVDELRRS